MNSKIVFFFMMMCFNENGTIKPVKMTSGGIKARPLR